MSTNFNPNTAKQMTFCDVGSNTAFYHNMKPAKSNDINNALDANIKLNASLDEDILDKKNEDKKKTLIKGGIIAAVIALAAAGLFKLKGKNTDKLAEAGRSSVDAAAKAAGADETAKAAEAAEEAVQKIEKIVDEINNPEFQDYMYRITPVSFDETSVEADISKWIKRLQKAPQEASVIQRGEHVRLNNSVDVKVLGNIKPHDYTNVSDIFLDTRTLHSGFPNGFAIIDGKMGNMKASYNDYTDYALGKSSGDYGYRAGISKDGRACVELHFKEKRQDKAARTIHTRILLRSKDDNFTQDQLDVIKVFHNTDKEKILNSPLGAAFMQEEEGSKNLTSLFFNKNMFLSLIKDEADKYKDFDVQGLLSEGSAERYINY